MTRKAEGVLRRMSKTRPGTTGSQHTEPRPTRPVQPNGDLEVAGYLKLAEQKSGHEPVPAQETPAGAERESIILIDFGSQYSLLIARRLRECNVYCEIVQHDTPWEKIAHLRPRGVILSGGPASV